MLWAAWSCSRVTRSAPTTRPASSRCRNPGPRRQRRGKSLTGGAGTGRRSSSARARGPCPTAASGRSCTFPRDSSPSSQPTTCGTTSTALPL
eukprot:8634978-Lingulodinium_polyedra.AAC.1